MQTGAFALEAAGVEGSDDFAGRDESASGDGSAVGEERSHVQPPH